MQLQTYDRLGRQKTIGDAVGTRTFGYNATDLELDSEDIQAGTGGLYTKLITRKHEATGSGEVPGRPAGFQVGTTGDPDADYDVTYHYDADGRIERIAGPGLPAYGVVYTRLQDSELVEHARYKSDASTTMATVQRGYEADRDLITSVQNSTSALVSGYTYRNDTRGRRRDVVYSGSAFAQGHLFKWGYNDRSELTTADRHLGSTPDTPGTRMTPGDYDYAYDPIGNRQTYRLDVDPTTYYCANAVNQYTSTDDAAGTCPTPPSPTEQFTYDLDGNLTQDGTFVYTWDAENRLVSVAPVSQPVDGSRRVAFAYDYMSRRVVKQVETYTSGAWGLTERLHFVYDEWNVVMVLDGRDGADPDTLPDNTVLRRYTWGLDLSGWAGDSSVSCIHGAGGIGGLLAVEDFTVDPDGGSRKLLFLYDANGNVGQVLDVTAPESIGIAASYEYDAYGNIVGSGGYYASTNHFRFSTKWFDAETGLYYYGYRYYSPRLGRWANRDPIEELGGLNLLGFVDNSSMNVVDSLGLAKIQCDGEVWWWYENDPDNIKGPHAHNKETDEKFYYERGVIEDKNGKTRPVNRAFRKKWNRHPVVRAKGLAVPALAAALFAVIADSAQAVALFSNPVSPCNDFYKAGLGLDCKAMEQLALRCYDDLVDNGLDKAALTFNRESHRLIDACYRASRGETDPPPQPRPWWRRIWWW